MQISTSKLNSVLPLEKNEYKYLSPYIIKNKNIYNMFFCNRKSKSNFYGEINIAESKDLDKWSLIKNVRISPLKNGEYSSFISPCIIQVKNNYYCFLEAQKPNQGSDIICFKSNNLIDWEINNNFFIGKGNSLYQSPFVIQIGSNIHLYYSVNKNNIIGVKLNENLEVINKFNCLKSELSNEAFQVYAPTIIYLNKVFIMLYSAWTSTLEGNINTATSKDGIHWIKSKINIVSLDKNTSIVSEPFLFKKNNLIYIYFEYKKEKFWNISYFNIQSEQFLKII